MHIVPPLPSQLGVVMVNGVAYPVMSQEERVKQLSRIQITKQHVDEFHKKRLTDTEQVQELANCMRDFEHFCTYYVTTFDPRLLPNSAAVPFILYDYQRTAAQKIIAAIRAGDSLLIEKSRDLGASWLMMAILTWFWLFTEEFHAHVGSRVEDQVDNGTVDSLLGKTDYILRHLPPWFQRLIPYDEKKCRKSLQRATYEGSLLSGESSNPNFGRGVRKAVVYVDEFAYMTEDRAVWTGIADVARCKIVSSTPAGEVNQFAELRQSGTIPILTFHWSQHPQKTWAWYETECAKRTPQAIASELNIDYRASAGRLAFPQLKKHRDAIIIPPIQIDPSQYKFYMSLDYGTTNPSALLVHAVARTKPLGALFPKIYTIWEYYEPSNVEKLSQAILTCPYHSLIERIYCDPSMFYDNQTGDDGKAVTNLAALFFRYYKIRLSAGKRGEAFMLAQLAIMWEQPIGYHIFNCCPNTIAEFESLQFVTQTTSMAQKRNTPERLRDKDNHAVDSFKYFFSTTFDAPVVEAAVQRDGRELMAEQIAGLKQNKLKSLTTQKKSSKLGRHWAS